MTINDKLRRMRFLRDDIRRVEAELKGLKGMFAALQTDVLDDMDAQGLTKISNEYATAFVKEEELPSVDSEHWPDVWRFLFEHGYLEVLRKQLNSTAWRELVKLGIDVPYVSTTTKRSLNLRATSS